MLIALTGTPGTGKTSVAKILARKYKILEINDFVAEHPEIIIEKDEERNSLIINVEKLAEELKNFDGIVVGHLSHYIPANMVIVLRTNPNILAERLRAKGFNEKKIMENVEAEAISLITSEALEIHPDSVYEVDTSNISIEDAGKIVEKIIEDEEFRKKYSAGKIDYSEVILSWY